MPNSSVKPMVRHTTLTEVPILGVVHVAASKRGLIAIAYSISAEQFLIQLASKYQHAQSSYTATLANASIQLREYLCGTRKHFSLPIDLSHLTTFQSLVLKAVARVPYGETRSYGEIAAQIGRPLAARAVGGANARNPLPMVIPCHRIIAADNSLGGYSGPGGMRTKRGLLDLERVDF